MAEKSEAQESGLRKFILVVFVGGWIAAVAAFSLFMRAWIPDQDLKADLAAIEEADTEDVQPDRLLPPTLQPISDPLPDLPVSGSTYVPLYNDLYLGEQRRLSDLSVTLSLRNTSADLDLYVTSITVFDERGKSMTKLLDGPHVLKPLAAGQFYMDDSLTRDDKHIATVIVKWSAEGVIDSPFIGALIIGSYGVKSLSLSIRGENRP